MPSPPVPDRLGSLDGRDNAPRGLAEGGRQAVQSRLSAELSGCSSLFDSTAQKTPLEVEMESWSTARLLVWRSVSSQPFDVVMGLIILANVVLMMEEANIRAPCWRAEDQNNCIDHGIWVANKVLLGIYTVECLARAYAEQSRYLPNRWNILDLLIVCFGYLDIVLGDIEGVNMNLARILRVFRLLRLVRLCRVFPELYVMVRGFMGAMKAMAFGMLLIFVLLGIWSLIMVEILHPEEMALYEDDPFNACADKFETVQKALVLLFQTLVAGDSWGSCAVPIIEQRGYGYFFLFSLSLVSVTLGFTNLVLAVIIEQATIAREGDKEDQLKARKKEEEASMRKWREVIKKIDADGNGTISYREMMEGFHIHEVRNTLSIMGIDQQDLKVIFKLMDEDGSGDLNYDEFIDTFLKAQGQDWRTYLMLMKLEIASLARSMKTIQDDILEHSKPPPSSQLPAWDAAKLEVHAGVHPGPHRARADSADLKQGPPAADMLLRAEFDKMNGYLQEQFEALQVKIELNAAAARADFATQLPTLHQQSDLALSRGVGSVPDKGSPAKGAHQRGEPHARQPQPAELAGVPRPPPPPSAKDDVTGSSDADILGLNPSDNRSALLQRLQV